MPDVFPVLARLGVQLRRGELHIVAAAPGVGKSVFAMTTALRGRVPTLYLAMDGSARSMTIRVVQAAQNVDRGTAVSELDTDGILAKQVLETVDWIRFDFPNRPDMEEIVHRAHAFGEIHGEFPHLIVVDNLMDVVEEQTAQAYSELEQDLTALARSSGAAVLGLHHVMGQYEGAQGPIPMSGLLYKPSKKTSLAMSFYPGAYDHELWVSVLKNRDGPKDPAGLNVRTKLWVDYSRMQAWGEEKQDEQGLRGDPHGSGVPVLGGGSRMAA